MHAMSMPMDIKEQIRKEIIGVRDSLTIEERLQRGRVITQRLMTIEAFRQAANVLFYASFRSEVPTLSLIEQTQFLGKKIIVPLVKKSEHRLELYEIKRLSELQPGYMRIPEPSVNGNRKVELDEINLIIIPGVAYDRKGNRIGYGGGYYDRLLAQLKRHVTIIAPSFDCQLVPFIPAKAYDVKVNLIITENEIIECYE